jgi:hypothetical protein
MIMNQNTEQQKDYQMIWRTCSTWVSVRDALPPEGKYVLVHIAKEKLQVFADPKDGRYEVAKLCRGISLKEREVMKRGDIPDPEVFGLVMQNDVRMEIKSKRSATIRSEDEHGNNQRPYNWQSFGPGDFFGQEVDYWMPIPSLVNNESPQ